MIEAQSRIPATVLTGFLGAGKSTLLRRVLTEEHGRRIAVIENEFGPVDVDSEIVVTGESEQIVQLSNGCLCCGIRDDLRRTLVDLAERRDAGELVFDHVMIETTGLADPGPIAQTFFLDDVIAARYRPDAVLTVVDARHGMAQLDTRGEARRQVGFADRLFISKADLVSAQEMTSLAERLSRMNPRAPQRQAPFGDVPLDEVFDVRGFNLNADLELSPPSDSGVAEPAAGLHHHRHDDDVRSFVFRAQRPLEGSRFGQFMQALVNGYGARLLRYKGVLHLHGVDRKVILQGVHQLMSHDAGATWAHDEARESRLVFIGLELPGEHMLWGLERCLV